MLLRSGVQAERQSGLAPEERVWQAAPPAMPVLRLQDPQALQLAAPPENAASSRHPTGADPPSQLVKRHRLDLVSYLFVNKHL